MPNPYWPLGFATVVCLDRRGVRFGKELRQAAVTMAGTEIIEALQDSRDYVAARSQASVI